MTEPKPTYDVSRIILSEEQKWHDQRHLAEAFRFAYRSRCVIDEYDHLTPFADAYLNQLRECMDEWTRHAIVLWEHAYRKKLLKEERRADL